MLHNLLQGVRLPSVRELVRRLERAGREIVKRKVRPANETRGNSRSRFASFASSGGSAEPIFRRPHHIHTHVHIHVRGWSLSARRNEGAYMYMYRQHCSLLLFESTSSRTRAVMDALRRHLLRADLPCPKRSPAASQVLALTYLHLPFQDCLICKIACQPGMGRRRSARHRDCRRRRVAALPNTKHQPNRASALETGKTGALCRRCTVISTRLRRYCRLAAPSEPPEPLVMIACHELY